MNHKYGKCTRVREQPCSSNITILVSLGVFNKTIIPFVLPEIVLANPRRYAPRWLSTISYPTRAHGTIVNFWATSKVP